MLPHPTQISKLKISRKNGKSFLEIAGIRIVPAYLSSKNKITWQCPMMTTMLRSAVVRPYNMFNNMPGSNSFIRVAKQSAMTTCHYGNEVLSS